MTPLSEPIVHDGLRRAAFRDPYTGALVEVLEEGSATPGGIRPRFYDLVPAVVYATVNVPDLAEARRFFVDTLGLEEEPGTVLHPPELEALCGLAGARRESFVARGGDVYLEVVRYLDPVGAPLPDDHLLSDRGLMNVAIGFREQDALAETYARVEAGRLPRQLPNAGVAGGTYLNDAQGNTLELLIAGRELDPSFGFAAPPPLPPHPRLAAAVRRPRPPLIGGLPWHVSLPHHPSSSKSSSATADVPLRVQIYAQRPELAVKFLEFGTTLREHRLLPGRLLELVRLRVAFWNQCRSCMAVRYAEGVDDGLTEALVCSLERPSEAPDLNDAERAAIRSAT